MKKVFLINEGKIPHYRIPVYSYLDGYLRKYNYTLIVVSEGVPDNNPYPVCFQHEETHLRFRTLSQLVIDKKPDAVIFWVGPRPYIMPLFTLLKLMKIKVIHWGHRRPMNNYKFIKGFVYNIEHWIDDAVILYSEQLRENVWSNFQTKTFIANNTLNLTEYDKRSMSKEDVKRKYNISTPKNIICMGRMEKRKRVHELVQAFQMLNNKDVGLILVGPDTDGILKNIDSERIFKFGEVHGEESLNLLSAADVYCLPGAIGLSIVDAFYCGLPVVTEDVIHGPEIMYLKEGVNGFITPKGDIAQLAAKLKILLTDDDLRDKYSKAAKYEIMTNGHIDKMCNGFANALQYVFK